MTAERKLELIEEIWDSLDPNEVPLTQAQRTELDRRLDAHDDDPNAGLPWDEVLRRIRQHRPPK